MAGADANAVVLGALTGSGDALAITVEAPADRTVAVLLAAGNVDATALVLTADLGITGPLTASSAAHVQALALCETGETVAGSLLATKSRLTGLRSAPTLTL
jgi:hypothetical protein